MAANGRANGSANASPIPTHILSLNDRLKSAKHVAAFHEDESMTDPRRNTGLFARLGRVVDDLSRAFAVKNWSAIGRATGKALSGQGPDKAAIAQLVASLSRDSDIRNKFMESQVKARYETLLHPPVTYLGDAFQYRTADGKFNSALHPHLGQAGAPYAKSVPAKTHMLGALPDPGDLFDRLMARQDGGRESDFGLSSMFLYHATLIIHDIFRTNELDKNISDTSSYLDLSPLYGFNDELQRKVRDDKYKLGLLKPDTFAEDRLLRQSPGVCIYMVMYNRYHNYCARQLYAINEGGRFSVPKKFEGSNLAAAARNFTPKNKQDAAFFKAIETYERADKKHTGDEKDTRAENEWKEAGAALAKFFTANTADRNAFDASYNAAWTKLDDDLFNTARLITCGMYIQISIFDYLKSVMGFHKFDTNFTLDPRINMQEFKNVSRGLGNQVSVEFNLLYRFHPAISLRDEVFAENYMREFFDKPASWNPKAMGLEEFILNMRNAKLRDAGKPTPEPHQRAFGLTKQADLCFKRNDITGLFDDQQMINELTKAMAAPISQFGPRNVPQCMKGIEMLGIMQARKWGVATLNDFRQFFGLPRHDSFADITGDVETQEALRDLYENVDKVELYPGLFCETREGTTKDGDPGPQNARSVMFIGIVADAITLVRSDRFYTVDWNTQNLTSWGMKEVTPDPDVAKGSVFHRLFQRAFPGWYPSDSIDFFQPFFTPKKNAEYAVAQGYAKDYRFSTKDKTYDTTASLPKRPSKPVYLTKAEDVKAVLTDKTDKIVHPVRLHLELLPPKVAEVLSLEQDTYSAKEKMSSIHVDRQAISAYLTELMRDMIVRNCMTMDSKKGVQQIDITKDFAIPVVSRYVSEFLGIGHLVECVENPKARYTENEIYRHITNCQVYLSYDADETKLLKRRQAFKASMKFLYDLALEGSAREANKWGITRFFGSFWPSSWRPNAMSELGFRVAQQILKDDADLGRAAARLLLVALDSAYNNVLTFTTVLNKLVDGLYNASTQGNLNKCEWANLQALAMSSSLESITKFEEAILKLQSDSVKLPIIRKVRLTKNEETHTVLGKANKILFDVRDGDTIICDPVALQSAGTDDIRHMAYSSNFTSHLSRYQSQQVAVLSLVSMIKVLAQMKNLRRGHDTQGHLKTIKIPSVCEGFETFMAPGRTDQIANDADNAGGDLSHVFDPKIFRPSMESYMTPEWDEMVPFPTTWKLRFEGFGPSDYASSNVLKTVTLPDSMPPFYMPKGPSSYGGTFGDGELSKEHVHARQTGLTDGCALGAK